MFILFLKIFFGRIIDVALGTVRMVLTVKEKHLAAALCGFVELYIWFTIVSEALESSDSGFLVVAAYAGGFSCGTYLGGKLSSSLIKGYAEIHAIIEKGLSETIKKLHDNGFGVSVINVNPSVYSGEKYLLIIGTSKAQSNKVREIIYSENPGAFVILDETKTISGGFMKKK